MKKIIIPLVLAFSFLAMEVKAQTVVVTRPVRRVVVVPSPVKVAVVRPVSVVTVRPARVVIRPRPVVVQPAPVVVYTTPPARTVVVKKTVVYR